MPNFDEAQAHKTSDPGESRQPASQGSGLPPESRLIEAMLGA
jgi:hypothetical protein